MDYSIPILFLPYSAEATKGKPPAEQQKATATLVPSLAKAAAEKPKTITKQLQEKPAKAPTIATPTPKTNTKKAEPLNKIVAVEPVKPVAPEKPIVKKNTETSAAKTTEKKIEQKENTVKNDTQALVSNNYREVEALRRGAQLQKELVQKWHPPIGVSPDCTCDISFFVTQQGTVENLKMVKSSGVMMFDISARQSLFSMKMPQWTYGNPLIITFKQ